MTSRTITTVVLFYLALSTGQAFFHTMSFHSGSGLDYPFPGILIPFDLRSSESLTCKGEGYFVHPTNCTRFYRCVDYSGAGVYYSKYLFECPAGNIFLPGRDVCVPGECEPMQPDGAPATDAAQTTEEQQTTEGASERPAGAGEEPEPPGPASEAAGDTTPLPEAEATEAPEEPTEAPAAPLEPASSESSSTSRPCLSEYVQDSEFCNVYIRCSAAADQKYVCNPGTAFDERRQMCRISAADDGLCSGKALFPVRLRYSVQPSGLIAISHKEGPLPDSYLLTKDSNHIRAPQSNPFFLRANPYLSNQLYRPFYYNYRHPFYIGPPQQYFQRPGNYFPYGLFPF